jgi:hypothetical protein
MWRAIALVAGFAGCYRDTGEPPPAVTSPAVALAQPAKRCQPDDLDQPVVDSNPGGRLRSHTEGPLSGSDRRTWVGPPVPPHVPTRAGTLELFVADDADGGILALYREPYDLSSCQLSGATNCAYEARHYDDRGRLAWKLALNDLLSLPHHIEVQDIRLAGGVLYFNEACQSYSSGAHGQCSRLVAIDPVQRKVLWRTDPLVSNGRFRVRGCYIVAGYGFTAEPDHVHVVDRATGRVLQSIAVSSSPEELTLRGRDRLDARLYSGLVRRYRLDNFDGAPARLVELDPPESIYGGMGYGGVGYGGASYGGRP